MATRREQAERRREDLMDTALAVFADKGVDGASIKDIAARAGITPGLVYHYFESKTDLITTVLRERGFVPRLRELLAGTADQPAAEVLRRVVAGFQQVLSENAQLVDLFFTASRAHDEIRTAMNDFVEEGQSMLTDYLRSRVEAGELRPHDCGAAANALFAAVAVGARSASATDVDELVDIVLFGVVAQGAELNG
ncbi:TetR/AcrR family transcriptional regulator [Nocardia sp. NBC_00881]|uniref:TetR/AcrR family transcriptional regulator n=1 Tax=Nocardia sp. NBC_00881 TaxID=2975995 RepID=UPI003867D2DE|nr:TetR/AcrR family transcriptional regulator [Nocardia sp. NBC_00881]